LIKKLAIVLIDKKIGGALVAPLFLSQTSLTCHIVIEMARLLSESVQKKR